MQNYFHLKMLVFLSFMLMNYNPMNILINFSFFLMLFFLNILFNFNEKFLNFLMMIFILGGMMIFISMLSSTMKFNFFKKNNLSIFIFFFFFYMHNIILNNFSLSLNLWNNFFLLYICFLLLYFIFTLKILLFKKQKNLKIYVINNFLFFF